MNTSNKSDISHFIVDLKDQDYKLYEDFINQYNKNGDLRFDEVPFRKGALVTGIFGLDEGFKKNEKNEMIWGYIRNHTGVDRSKGGTINGVKDVVQSPFDFDKSFIEEFGDISYGTLIHLINYAYQFEFRIAHMNPNTTKRKATEKGSILPEVYEKLKNKGSFRQGEILGSAGSLGDSSGAHTHTEIKSLDESCEVFEILLYNLYKEEGLKEYTTDEVIYQYRNRDKYLKSPTQNILRDYNELRKEKRIIFMNKYKTQYVDLDDTVKTRYASNLLLNGL